MKDAIFDVLLFLQAGLVLIVLALLLVTGIQIAREKLSDAPPPSIEDVIEPPPCGDDEEPFMEYTPSHTGNFTEGVFEFGCAPKGVRIPWHTDINALSL